MIVYRNLERVVDAQRWLRENAATVQRQLLLPQPDHETAVKLLIEFGEIEAALCDRLMPQCDSDLPETRALRRVAVGVGHLLRSAWHRLPAPGGYLTKESLLALIEEARVPSAPLHVRVAEGFAHYGLYPETYLQAAEAFAKSKPATTAICIGLRTIGAALSAVVTAALQAAGWQITTITLRPRGEPFARQLTLDHSLRKRLQPNAFDYALIVDEGPGLSGSSFCGAAEALAALGFADERIIFFPSWSPDASRFFSARARERWPRHAHYVGDFEESWIHSGRLCEAPLLAQDSGRWRSLFFSEAEFPPVHPHHERRKYLTIEPAPRLLKFAGLGPYGEAALQRAEILAQAGYGPPAFELRHGFLIHPFLQGRPLDSDGLSPSLIEWAARYFAFLQRTFPSATRTTGAELCAMVNTNLHEAFGDEREFILPALSAEAFEQSAAVEVDGRVQPWEWIDTAHGLMKVDSIDHHADHFFPGCTDIAWDLAGFISEFRLDDDGIERLLQRFARHSGDMKIVKRLPLFRLAYGAFRLGYTQLAEQTLAQTPEAERFRRDSERYRSQLRALCNAMNPARPTL